MDAKEQARIEIAALIKRFEADTQRTQHNEAQMGNSYILPLFAALGWAVQRPDEVMLEVKISGGFADYGFYVNNSPVFYLEIKRIKKLTIDDMKQSINYSYLKGVTWSVLTNFEELMVFNADWETSKPAEAQFLYFKHTEFLEQLDDLWLLSKPAAQSNPRLIDQQAERYGRKAKREPITTTLFNDLRIWRRSLFNEIRGQKATLWAHDARKVDNAVQKFFDRLIFLRTIEDRGVDEHYLKSLRRQQKIADIFPSLLKLFRQLDGIYNSNLFEQHDIDFMEVYDPGLVTEIIDGLYRPKGGYIEYNFSAIDADILGTVYEQYLSFKALDPEAKIDVSKTRQRKKQGIYYTPKPIVRYIVQQTLGRALAEGVDHTSIRVLDPACGSGSFLIEAFDVLDKHYQRLFPDASSEQRAAWRHHILLNNLYGVDLDEQAVEVTRLNLTLRAALAKGKLPPLTHIKHGNSLIEDNTIAGDRLGFNWPEKFPYVFDPLLTPNTPPRTEESSRGFDVIIGNPPYVPIESMSNEERTYYQRHYPELERKYDTSIIFLLKAFQLLRPPHGRVGFISSISWQTGENFGNLRKRLFTDKGLEEIVNLPFDVFKDAYVDTGIFIVSSSPTASYSIHRFPKKATNVNLSSLPYVSIERNQISTNNYKVILDPVTHNITQRVRNNSQFTKLGDITISTQGLASSQYIDVNVPSKTTFPFLREGQVYRYELQKDKVTSVNLRPSSVKFYEAKSRLLIRRLINRDDRLMVSYTDEALVSSKDINPFVVINTQLSTLYLLGLMNSKLISYIYTNASTIATKDDFRQTTLAELRAMPIRNLDLSNPVEKDQHDQLVRYVEKMLSLKRQQTMVNDALNERRHELQEQIQYLDQQIDRLVYQLYDLTEDEIKLVEGA